MFFFDTLFRSVNNNNDISNEDLCFYRQDFTKKNLSYKDCTNIYYYWPLGKRIARSLPNFAMSAERIITFEDMPVECIKRFNDTEVKYEINKTIKKLATYARIYGLAGIFVAHTDKDYDKPLTYKDFEKGEVSFNVLDPLNLNGIKIGQDPLLANYQKVTEVMINGKLVDINRCLCVFNDFTFYLKFTPSTFNYGSASVYQNMEGLITSWYRCVEALERCATKAGSILYKGRDGGVINSITIEAARKTLNIINNLRTNGIAEIEKDANVEFFNLTGVGEIDVIINQMNQIMLMALSDTPAAILLDKELAQGFGNGEEDMKAILMAVDDYRKSTLQPIYDFIDKFVMYLAFTPEFIKDLQDQYSQDFKGMSISQIREAIFDSFSFEWGNLYPETEATRCDNNSKKLDNLMKLKELGATTADIEEIINNDKDLYAEEITLEEKSEDIDSEDDYNSFISGGTSEAPETREDINKDTE